MVSMKVLFEFICEFSFYFLVLSCFALFSIVVTIKKKLSQVQFKQLVLDFIKVDRDLIFLVLLVVLALLSLLSINKITIISQAKIILNPQAKFVYMLSPLMFSGFAWYLLCQRLLKILCSLIVNMSDKDLKK